VFEQLGLADLGGLGSGGGQQDRGPSLVPEPMVAGPGEPGPGARLVRLVCGLAGRVLPAPCRSARWAGRIDGYSGRGSRPPFSGPLAGAEPRASFRGGGPNNPSEVLGGADQARRGRRTLVRGGGGLLGKVGPPSRENFVRVGVGETAHIGLGGRRRVVLLRVGGSSGSGRLRGPWAEPTRSWQPRGPPGRRLSVNIFGTEEEGSGGN